MKAYRSGKIQTDLFTLPVKLFPVVQKPRSNIQLFDTQNQSPVGLRYYSKKTGRHISKNQIIKAISTTKGDAIFIKSIAKKNPEKSLFPLLQFTDPKHIDWRLLGNAYYVVPTKPDSWYDALHQTLLHHKKAALLGFTTRTNQPTTAVLISSPEILLLFQLRAPNEIAQLPNYKSLAVESDKVSLLNAITQ